jgi:heme-degrading monooxygenase HmoA
MITEHALLPVLPGQEEEFEAAFREAHPLIASAPGFHDLSLSRSIESPNMYLLLVRWQAIEDHTEGFRQSESYAVWRKLLHHFYRPFPVVEHYKIIEL